MWGKRDSRRVLAQRLGRPMRHVDSDMQLHDGSRIAVIGGGPAGSLFAYFLLDLAAKIDLKLHVDIYEPKHFSHFGPAGCNHCGGIVSESLVQFLALEGIELPRTVVQRGIDAYELHTDAGNVRIVPPLKEKRIAAVHRGGGPKGVTLAEWESFDGHLLKLAQQKGARVRHEMVTDAHMRGGFPHILTAQGSGESYELAVVAAGVSSRLIERFEAMGVGFKQPATTTAFICEFHLGEALVQQQFQTAMHIFLLNIPRVEFAAMIPKKSFVTVCLLGEDIDEELVTTFLNAPEVRNCFPAVAGAVRNASCHCFPRMNIQGCVQPFADRLIFIGDAGVTRLNKDGIGAAYRTSKAAAQSAILGGVAAADLRYHFLPTCRRIMADNNIGKMLFWAIGMMQGFPFTRRAMVHMTAVEQQSQDIPRDMSSALWDMFTGSAPYREILLRMLKPGFIARLAWSTIIALLPQRFRALPMEERRESQ